jgi:hypothetical protein
MLCSDFLNDAGHFIFIIRVSTVHMHNKALHELLLCNFNSYSIPARTLFIILIVLEDYRD